MMNIPTIHLVLLIAAVWRLANFIAHKEEGPFRILWLPHIWARRLVRKNKKGLFAQSRILEALECEYCLSVWFGSALSFVYGLTNPGSITGVGWFVVPLALSTGAIIIKHILFLIKSVDTRFDQQNQAYLEAKAELAKRLNGNGSHPRPGTPEWDALVFEQNILERR